MPHAALTARWDQNLPAYGGWLVESSHSALDGYAQAGFHYVCIDCQHTVLDEAAVAEFLSRYRDAPIAILTRVSEINHALIGKLLDAGSDGILVPQVDTADEARAVVDACRYPPHGSRSLAAIRAGLGATPAEIEARALCLLMIETEEGLNNVEEICSVPGVSGIYVGPSDLSLSMGMVPSHGFSTDQLKDVFARIKAACDANGLVLGAHALDAKSTAKFLAWGCRYISLGTNTLLFSQAARALFAELPPQ
jgi:2-keto-3-deoxy-L-rhamnonate aldolase RhmA